MTTPSPPPAVIASNLRRIGKGTLVDSCDLEIPRWGWLKIHGVIRHRNRDKEWVQFPSREWLDNSGDRQFAVLLTIGDKEVDARLKAAALNAMRALAGEGDAP